MGPIKEGSSYCPQSEPVKRKVYAGSATYGRIQKTLGEHVMLRNSDGDTATDDTGACFFYIALGAFLLYRIRCVSFISASFVKRMNSFP